MQMCSVAGLLTLEIEDGRRQSAALNAIIAVSSLLHRQTESKLYDNLVMKQHD